MPLDSVIMKGYQGDEKELEERIIQFLNLPPAKKVRFFNVWTVGIEVYVMIIFGKGKATVETAQLVNDIYGKITSKLGEY